MLQRTSNPYGLVVALGPAPCDGCVHAPRCKALNRACASFAAFVAGEPQRQWEAARRVPNGEIFTRLYGEAV